MYCMKCGTEFEADTCPKCGEPAPTSNDFVPPEAPAQEEAAGWKPPVKEDGPESVKRPPERICPECASHDFSYQAIDVYQTKTFGRYLVCLLIVLMFVFVYSSVQALFVALVGTTLALPTAIVGCVLLILYLMRTQTEVETYAVCKHCGHTYRVK